MQSGMVEFIGLLKIMVLKGRDLAVRDVLTSDPYVKAILGWQVRSGVDVICITWFDVMLIDNFIISFATALSRLV